MFCFYFVPLCVSLPVFCLPLSNQLSHKCWKKYSNSCNGCEDKKALIKVVKQYLTLPPTSTNVERLFSYAGMVMEDRRALLLLERVNKILFLWENLTMLNFKLDWWMETNINGILLTCKCILISQYWSDKYKAWFY